MERPPRVRIQVVGYAFIVGGFLSVMFAMSLTTARNHSDMMLIQMCAYGIGLTLLLVHWLRTTDVGPDRITGLRWLLILTTFCGMAVLMTS